MELVEKGEAALIISFWFMWRNRNRKSEALIDKLTPEYKRDLDNKLAGAQPIVDFLGPETMAPLNPKES